jgi:hypothetical protein
MVWLMWLYLELKIYFLKKWITFSKENEDDEVDMRYGCVKGCALWLLVSFVIILIVTLIIHLIEAFIEAIF